MPKPALAPLDLSRNELADLAPLAPLTKLETLRLARNRIRSVDHADQHGILVELANGEPPGAADFSDTGDFDVARPMGENPLKGLGMAYRQPYVPALNSAAEQPLRRTVGHPDDPALYDKRRLVQSLDDRAFARVP